MNTTAAALEAHVTVATIRAWCRIGAVTAVTKAGRWIVDTASLAARLAIGKMKRWQKNGHDRVYLYDWAELAGIETTRYNTGNISSACYQGEGISNSQAYKLLGCIDKVWFDAADGKLHARYGWTESRVATREQVWAAVVAGVRAAIAAL